LFDAEYQTTTMASESVLTVRGTPAVRRILTGLGAAALAGIVLYLLDATGDLPGGDRLYDGWIYCAVLLICGGAIGLRAVLVSRERAAWAALAASHVTQVSGWVCYWLFVGPGENPAHPPAADAFWMVSYLLALGAIILMVRARATRFDGALVIDAILGVLTLAALSSAIVIPRILDTSADNGAVLVSLTYPVADLVIAGIMVTVFALNGWRPAASWAVLGVALAVEVVADSVHLYNTAGGTWQPGTPLGAAMLVASMLAVGSAWTAPEREEGFRLEGWRMLAVPGAFTLTAIGLLVYGTFARIDPVAAVLATAALAIAGARSISAFRGMLHLAKSHELALEAALRDPLTGLFNHRAFHDSLGDAVERAHAAGEPLCLVMLDLVGLKKTNETLGHQAGDERLRLVAAKLTGVLRSGDTAYRIGGDEFAVILPGVQAWDGYNVGARLQRALSGEHWGGAPAVSIGVADAKGDMSKTELIGHADAALLEAKRSHRKTVLYSVGLELQSDALEATLPRVHTKALATSLARAVDAKDSYTRSHCETVAELCVTIAERLGLEQERVEHLRLAGLLHDVGKIGVPDTILQKPGPLSDAEYETMKAHSRLGHSIVSGAGLVEEARWILHHHERPDGRGYPAGLRDDEIPLESRIILVADAFEAMTSDRPYRRSVPASAALEELHRHSGTQFDPDCVAALEQALTGARERVPA
jgi:diguanylate cyclase (GGDEF)-like protein